MIEFLAQMPTDTMIFITTVFLGLAATLIGLKWLIYRRVPINAQIAAGLCVYAAFILGACF